MKIHVIKCKRLSNNHNDSDFTRANNFYPIKRALCEKPLHPCGKFKTFLDVLIHSDGGATDAANRLFAKTRACKILVRPKITN